MNRSRWKLRSPEDVLSFELHDSSTSKPSYHVGNPILIIKNSEIGFSGWVVVLLLIGNPLDLFYLRFCHFFILSFVFRVRLNKRQKCFIGFLEKPQLAWLYVTFEPPNFSHVQPALRRTMPGERLADS